METKSRMRNTAAYYSSYIVIGFAQGIIGPTLPGLAKQTGASLNGISLLFPILSVGYIIGSYFSGRLIDRTKGHPVMGAVILLLMAVNLFVPFTPMLYLLLTLFFFVGLASGSVDVGGNTLLIWTHRDKVGPFMVGLHFCYGVGAFIAPMVVGQALKITGNIAWGYWILAMICAPVIIYLFLLRSPEHSKPETEETSMGKNRLLVFLITLFMFFHVGAELSFGGWIYTYAVKKELASITQAAYLTSAYWGSLTAARLISVIIAMKLKARTLLVIDLLGCIVATLLFLLFPDSSAAAWTGTVLLGFFIASLIPMTFTFTGESVDITGRVTSWLVMGLAAGNLVFPRIIGMFFESVGPVMLPAVILGTIVLSLVLLFIMFGYTNRRQLKA